MAVPILDADGNPKFDDKGAMLMRRTRADSELADCNEFGFYTRGEDGKPVFYPSWKYLEKWGRIQDRNSPKLIPLEFNQSQIALYKALAAMKRKGKPVRINDGKSRQLGGTTIVSGLFFTLAAFVPGTKVGIIADTLEHGQGILDKYKTFWETIPDYLKHHGGMVEVTNNSSELSIGFADSNGNVKRTSTFKVVVQGEKAGRSAHYNLLHESEVATWDNIAATVGALEATVSGMDRSSIIIRETTAQGVNHWKTLFDMGMAGRGTYESIFLPWYLEDSYSHPWREHELNDYEVKLRDELHLRPDQIQFWRDKWEDYDCDFVTMGKEYPTFAVEMFQSTGYSFFNSRLVGEVKDKLMGTKPLKEVMFSYAFESSSDGRYHRYTHIKPIPTRNGGTKIYKEPKLGHPYILAIDPARGGRDFWAAHVIDNSSGEQVAVFHKQGISIDADEAGKQLLCLYWYYQRNGELNNTGELKEAIKRNRVLIGWENNTGTSLQELTTKAGIQDVYIDQSKVTIDERFGNKWGWHTGTDNRPMMLDMLKALFRDNPSMIADYETIVEMEGFQYQQSGIRGQEKPMAMDGYHDDLVMSYAGFCYMRSYWESNIENPREEMHRARVFDPLGRETQVVENAFMNW